ATQVGDAETDDVVVRRIDLKPGFAGCVAVEWGRPSHRRSIDGFEGIPDADDRESLGSAGNPCFIQSLCHHGEGVPGAYRKCEPIGLANVSEAPAPQSAGRQSAR